ncbi:DUF2780 domain-containing protein [Ferrimonas gelatinilytica]|uniref:DUF2780 domain-containing protein n=1 Tax=Ferrimonas gelatinilytica TaxID=1255257 RepID=A0ABP9SB44_9GAMM
MKIKWKLLCVMSVLGALIGPVQAEERSSAVMEGDEAVSSKATQGSGQDSLVDTLTSRLGVSDQQASGGAGALLALAQASLSGEEWGQLTSLIPQAGALAGKVDLSQFDGGTLGTLEDLLGDDKGPSMANVMGAFDNLGLDVTSISSFVPVILDYLQQQGGAELVDTLTQLWAPSV